ncbi:MAG TPA: hypothetical protein VKU01_16605 [Bryobacteraceae bacterium]|nr:hypothetical protein [Bryobacteraceae bacterium]
MFTLRPEQMKEVESGLFDSFIARLMIKLRALWPDQTAALGDGYKQFLEFNIQRCSNYGIETELAIARIINLGFIMGPYFESRPDALWAMQILKDPTLRGPVKAHQLSFRARQDLQATGYPATDDACCRDFGERPVNAAIQSCGANVQNTIPCDIDDVVLYESPGYRGAALTGGSGVLRQQVLEVVGEPDIHTYVYPYAAHDESHVLVKVLRPGESPIVHRTGTPSEFKFAVQRAKQMVPPVTLLSRIFNLSPAVNRYQITAESCGVRNSGSVNLGGTMTVVVYPLDQYALTVSIPPLVNAESTTIQLWHNGQPQDIAANLTNLIGTLRLIEVNLNYLKSLIQQSVPQAYIQWSVSFLEGQLSIATGYREALDHRVYFGCSARIALTIFRVRVTLTFGALIGAALARLEATIDDATLAVDTTWIVEAPTDVPVPETAQGSLSFPVRLNGRARATPYSLRVRTAAGSGFHAEGGLRLTSFRALELFAHIHWRGIDAFVNISSPSGGEEEMPWHFVDSYEIWPGMVLM